MVAHDSLIREYNDLLAAIDDGWTIEPPVYTMTERQGQRVVYHFILWRESRPGVKSVSDGPEVREFIHTQHYHLEPLH